MDILIKVGQLLLSLSILIVLHEMGHFFPARWFKTRVEKFYLFFDAPPFNSLWSTKKGETEYGIGWLPLGGYVKISGMVDESMDTEFKNSTPQPWEFRSKPAWQRLIIMLGGVTVNFVLGFLIYGLLLWAYGREYIPTSETRQNGIAFDSVLLNQGFQNGDVILKLGNEPFDRFDPGTFVQKVVLGNSHDVSVLRNGQEKVIRVSDDIDRKVTDLGVPKSALLSPRFAFLVTSTQAGSPSEKAGLKKDDQIVGFNDQKIDFFDDFVRLARQYKGQTVNLSVIRGGTPQNISITVDSDGKIGAGVRSPFKIFKTEREEFSLLQAMPQGVSDGMDFLRTQIGAFGKMITGQISASKNLGGFISIGNMFPKASEFSWEGFWRLTATLSLILAFMNLLPIPALDGGYVVFLLWEVITGRKVSDAFMEKAVTVGFFLLMGLLLFANGMDIIRNLF